ncbi:SH3-domain-containing protein [Coniophora puteana RWD-64-598 SS2]|uniref:SH3-domain-containing protein n=1 Tax=Coniophora puteana (strain RWD-64-598) TaxID=741705 RepID=A0A5M3MY38_CONPW|nr:SH3-domain-containing protein [Coniophora puteana RWD-64-598 SS2]EIW84030.1 SH3-domain-containing protein [Coniophora puteana RWD-64-598 SS2]
MTDIYDHLISQTRSNIQILISHNKISEVDGNHILSKLPSSRGVDDLVNSAGRLAITQRNGALSPSRVQEARASWDWPGDGPGDLSFRKGDIIEIVSETNAEWWTGRLHGKQGTIPANHVEKLSGTPTSRAPPPPPAARDRDTYYEPKYSSPGPPAPYSPGPPMGYHQPPPGPPMLYGPPPGPPMNYQGPPPGPPMYQPPAAGPPPNGAYNPYMPPASAPPAPQEPQKQGRFGNLGNTLAQSAAGGLGFGAGSAIGGDIVHSIF